MNTCFFRLWFLMLSFNEAIAQNNLPPAYELISDTGAYVTIDDAYWQFLEDKEGKWTTEDVIRSPITDAFRANDSKTNGVDYRVHVYWIRYRLKNTMNRPVDVVLLNSTLADKTDFYLFDEGSEVFHHTTGEIYPNKKKDGLKKINGIPIQLDAYEELTIYNRIENNYYFNKPKYLSVSIGFLKDIIQENYIDAEAGFLRRIFDAFFVGVLLFACIFNLFFYSIVGDRVYLYYALFLLYFSFDPNLLTDLFPNQLSIIYTIDGMVWSSGIFLFVQFLRYFLRTFERFPTWDKALIVIGLAHPIVSVARFFIEPHLMGRWSGLLAGASYFLFLVGLFMILITCLKYIRSSSQFSRVLLVSAIPASIFWSFGFGLLFLFQLLNERYGVEPPGFIGWLNTWSHTLNLCFVLWFVVSFSWILILQFVRLRKENTQQALDKEKLAREAEIEKNRLIELQKIELEKTVETRTAELKHSLESLKSAQAQLIQSEKMVSLGELTAGIAHEIQNPLNFVNNFSELNAELFDDLEQEVDKGNLDEVKSIAKDIKENQQKINHHGKRADAIVKGMLQHSRISNSVKELTDINALTDEYLRLAYHGARAKNKSFNVTVKSNFDETAGKINIIPQDIGRVILNLINNAFYAVSAKASLRIGATADGSYDPTVSVSTKKIGDKVEVRVVDNGNGISPKILDKIFQPFFTTKPTGQGTGLGLSLAYDIVKAHGGELKVDTKEGEGAVFTIQLPFN